MLNLVPVKKSSTLSPEKNIAIEKFWRLVSEETFLSHDNINIAYAVNFNAIDRPYIIIVPGRSESYLKYKELAYDFDQQGFDCVIIDHRGQGLSQRLLKNRYKGYVENFDDYTNDLHQLLNNVLPKRHNKLSNDSFMLAHSMGGAIAIRYLQKYQHNIQALALSSPMIAINSGSIPLWLASAIVRIGVKLNNYLSNNNLQKDSWYFLGQGKHEDKATSFSDNILMHSHHRYQCFQELYQQRPELQLGGVTFNWLKQALNANKNIFRDINKIKLPVLLMQAGEEEIVDNEAQNKFCQELHKINPDICFAAKPMIISGAYHELFFEIDEYRNTAMDATISWFQSNMNTNHSDSLSTTEDGS